MDKRLTKRLGLILQDLHTQITVLDTEGNSLIPENGIRFVLPENLDPGQPVLFEGRLYLACRKPEKLILSMPAVQHDGYAADMLRLTRSAIEGLSEQDHDHHDMSTFLTRVLYNEISPLEMQAMAENHRLTMNVPRCVVLFQLLQAHGPNASQTVKEILPKANGDLLILPDSMTVLLIRDMTGVGGTEELRQYAEAFQETVITEMGVSMTIGIGETVPDLAQLHESYLQAKRAVEIGRTYSPGKSIYVFHNMLLERFLSDLSPDMAEYYYSLVFNRSTARLFSDEMLYTIDMFFEKDLNLSDTARQLYIHRNTLVYRLDKIERQTGLNLRRFEDAMTFKMLLEMRKCIGETKDRNRHRK